MTTNYMTTKRTKHIDVRHHVIRYWCKEDVLDFAYTNTHGQLTDMMTKVLTRSHFTRHRASTMSNMDVADVRGPFKPEYRKFHFFSLV